MGKKVRSRHRPTYKQPGNNQVAQFDRLLRAQAADFAARYKTADGKLPQEIELDDGRGGKVKQDAAIYIANATAEQFRALKKHKDLDQGLIAWALKEDRGGNGAAGWKGQQVQDVWIEDGLTSAGIGKDVIAIMKGPAKKKDDKQNSPKDLRSKIDARTDIDAQKKEKVKNALEPTDQWKRIEKQDANGIFEKMYYVRVKYDANGNPANVEKSDRTIAGSIGEFVIGMGATLKPDFIEKGEKIFERTTGVEIANVKDFDDHIVAVAPKKEAPKSAAPPANANTNANTASNANAISAANAAKVKATSIQNLQLAFAQSTQKRLNLTVVEVDDRNEFVTTKDKKTGETIYNQNYYYFGPDTKGILQATEVSKSERASFQRQLVERMAQNGKSFGYYDPSGNIPLAKDDNELAAILNAANESSTSLGSSESLIGLPSTK